MPKRNFGYEKRQKELERARKQEQKRQRKRERAESPPAEPVQPSEAAPQDRSPPE